MSHPNDNNGDVLRRMEARGDDLSQPRNVDFTVVFADEESAKKFADHFKELGYAVSTEFSGVKPDLPWDVCVVKNMTPSHRAIGEFEDLLQDVADTLGGHNDGWGCFTMPVAQ